MLDPAELADLIAEIVGDATAPLLKRIAELEARTPIPGERGSDGLPGHDGIDGKDGLPGASGRNGEDGAPGDPGRDGANGVDGKDGEQGPAGRDGIDGTHGKDGAAGSDGRDGRDGVNGKDGVGLAGALIDRSGALVVTLSDGTARELGAVVGRDGVDGLDGTNGSNGTDGAPGRDGADGLGFDDLTVEHDGCRGFTFRFVQGERSKAFAFELPVVIDRGVFRSDETYSRGDAVSFGGSLWIAQTETKARPDGPDTGWRLAVKKGRDGRDGKDGERGLEGKEGPAGRDLTQLGFDGNKH